MLLTDLEKEILAEISAQKLTWQELGDRMHTTRQEAYDTVHRRKAFMSERVLRLIEALGYDVEINFIRKK